MKWVLREIHHTGFQPPSLQPLFVVYPPPPSSESDGGGMLNLNNKVSPSVLLIIIILAVIFFISGLLHLLVRCLLRPSTREPDEMDNVTVLQGQLQQLFHLHDSGVDQSFIDALPVFNYKAIIGVKDPFDCAVCLCEFESEDKLRLLPKCSHAFHMECIDTWLLSHSTCPLCRATLLPDFSTTNTNCSPIFLVLESGESSREVASEMGIGRTNSIARVNSHLSAHREDLAKVEEKGHDMVVVSGEKVMQVKLGKFRNIDGGGGGEGSSGGGGGGDGGFDARRCFSMGSFAYVMDDNTSLQVPVRTPLKKQFSKKPFLPLTPGHRHVMSECGGESGREFGGIDDAFRMVEVVQSGGSGYSTKSIERSKGESFSLSKIWLRGKKDKAACASTRRAVSFRYPAAAHELQGGKNAPTARTASEIHMNRWENWGSEMGCEDEIQSCHSLDSQSNPQSFARRSLLWLIGRSNTAVHSFSSNV